MKTKDRNNVQKNSTSNKRQIKTDVKVTETEIYNADMNWLHKKGVASHWGTQ